MDIVLAVVLSFVTALVAAVEARQHLIVCENSQSLPCDAAPLFFRVRTPALVAWAFFSLISGGLFVYAIVRALGVLAR